jgi:hypothetical protein
VEEGECSRNIMYSPLQMEKWELLKLFYEEGRGIKENVGGMNLTKIHCKHFVNVTVYPQYNNNMPKNFIKKS